MPRRRMPRRRMPRPGRLHRKRPHPEEAPTEDAPPEDAPTGDGSDGPAPADDAAAGDSETAAHGRPGAPYSVTSGHHGCPHRPLSRYHDAVPSWSDWCLDRDYWIVEVTCRPPHAEAGRKVRFNADPAVVPELLLYDVCGNADPISECPPSDAGSARFSTRSRPWIGHPGCRPRRGRGGDLGFQRCHRGGLQSRRTCRDRRGSLRARRRGRGSRRDHRCDSRIRRSRRGDDRARRCGRVERRRRWR